MALGIDVGGTKILGIKYIDGKILREWNFKTVDGEVKCILQKIMKESGEDVIGIGVPCYIRDGACIKAPHIRELTGKKLDEIGNARFMNDCTAMAYGEYHLRGEKHDPLLLIALGTGVGSGLIIQGKPYIGKGSAMEIGHIKIYSDKRCECGKIGCFETMAGGKYLNTAKMYMRVKRGDEKALKFFENYGKIVARGIAPAIQLLDPEIVVIGGSISQAYEYFMPSLIGELEKLLSYITPDDIIFERAKSSKSGAIGAALIAERDLL